MAGPRTRSTRTIRSRRRPGAVEHPAEVTRDQRNLLSTTLRDFGIESVPGSGQYINEEQPGVVIAAVARLDHAAP